MTIIYHWLLCEFYRGAASANFTSSNSANKYTETDLYGLFALNLTGQGLEQRVQVI